MTRAADLLVNALVAHGVDRLFCVPGESYLSVLDALTARDEIDVVTTRHESGAGFMALADARLTGRPGVAFVSRGPGAMNAAIAVHSSQQDAVPLVLFIGQVERAHRNMGAFQEVDYGRVFGPMVKWAAEVNDASRLADTVATAFHAAASGTPGPAVVVLPEDMLDDDVTGAPVTVNRLARAAAPHEDITWLKTLIDEAKRPLIVAGGLLKANGGETALRSVAEAFGIPVAAAVRHADLMPGDHPNYAGHMTYGAPVELLRGLKQADIVIAVGTRLGDVTTQGYAFPAAPAPEQRVVQVWPDAAAVGSVRSLDMGIAADPLLFLDQLRAVAPETPSEERIRWCAELHATATALRQWTGAAEAPDGIVFGAFVEAFDRLLGDEAIITLDAGNFGGWVQKHMRFGGGRAMLAPASGAMGYGVPAAVAASLRHPDRKVVCFVGDGGFLMTGSELATAMQSGAAPILVVSDNGSYGTIRMHQEKHFPGRVGMTGLTNPDFAAMATAYGALGLRVETVGEIEEAITTALSADRPVVISVRTSLQHISAAATIDALRAASR